MDIKTKEQRSANMAAITSRNTKPEVTFRKWLFSLGFRYSLHPAGITGRPDLYMRKYNTCIFINGCFWHRHTCKYAYIPKSNTEFWNSKFAANVARDIKVRNQLQSEGYKVLYVWECTVKKMKKEPEFRNQILSEVTEFLNRPEKGIFREF